MCILVLLYITNHIYNQTFTHVHFRSISLHTTSTTRWCNRFCFSNLSNCVSIIALLCLITSDSKNWLHSL